MDEKKPAHISNDIWLSYESGKDVAIRNHIMMEYLDLVKAIASRMFSTYRNFAEHDDIISCGTLALMDAIERFDCRRNIKFETFASIKIRGAIIDYLRKQDWVPRTVRKNLKDIDIALNDLRNKNGKSPSDEEMAEYLGIDINDYRDMLGKSTAAAVISLEETISDATANKIAASESGPEEKFIEEEITEMISGAVDELNEKEKMIVSLYYYEGLKAKQIAHILELSESRVSQIHAKALIKMKAKIGKYIEN